MERNIHFVALGDYRPPWFGLIVERFRSMNPGWEIIIHENLFPMADEYEAAIKNARTVGEQCDVMRLACLERWGGWYFDWDVFPLRPLDHLDSVRDLDGRLLLGPVLGFSRAGTALCAGAVDCKAWPAVRAIMAGIGERGTLYGTTFERHIADHLTEYHADVVRVGSELEFALMGSLQHNKAAFQSLLDGKDLGDTGRTAFVHGWAATSLLPRVEVTCPTSA